MNSGCSTPGYVGANDQGAAERQHSANMPYTVEIPLKAVAAVLRLNEQKSRITATSQLTQLPHRYLDRLVRFRRTALLATPGGELDVGYFLDSVSPPVALQPILGGLSHPQGDRRRRAAPGLPQFFLRLGPKGPDGIGQEDRPSGQ